MRISIIMKLPDLKAAYLAHGSGEGNQQNVDDMLAAALEYYGERGLLDDTTVPLTLERERRGAAAAVSPLRYPGKLATDLAGRRLFISDSNNHRHAAFTICCNP